MFEKTAVLEVLEKCLQKEISIKQFELPNPPTYNYTENWHQHKCLMWAFR